VLISKAVSEWFIVEKIHNDVNEITAVIFRGQMDYKAEVHQYWPEFAQNGKANITVEMLLSHQVSKFYI